jgi:hypothetical protein
LACQDKFFVTNSFDGKENGKHALDFTFRLSQLFRLGEFGLFMYIHAFIPECVSSHCQGLYRTLSKIWAKFYAVPL